MKKLVLSLSLLFVGGAFSAQQIDINTIFMTEAGVQDPSMALNPTELESEADVTLWFNFTNNLNDTIQPNDSLSFGWEIDGTSQGSLTQATRNNAVDIGGSVNSFLQTTYTLPADGSFEICVWPLFNPYDPNTDPNTGRTCQTFEIEEEEEPNSVTERVEESMKLYTAQNQVVIETGQAEGLTHMTVFDLTGKMVFNRNLQLSTQNVERINVSTLKTGMYIVRLSQYNSVIKTEKVILR